MVLSKSRLRRARSTINKTPTSPSTAALWKSRSPERWSNVRSCIHNRLSKVWRWEILTIASAEEMEISKSLLSRLEWLSQERVRSTTQRQGSFSHWCGLIFSEISTSRPSCSFMSETKVPRYPASAQNFWIDGHRSYARFAVDIPPFVS